MIDKRKIILTNSLFGGNILNESNLDFEVSRANETKNPYRKLAHLTRAMTAGHSFSNGNKRTALVVNKAEGYEHNIQFNSKKLARTILNLSKKQETRIPKIEMRLRKCKK